MPWFAKAGEYCFYTNIVLDPSVRMPPNMTDIREEYQELSFYDDTIEESRAPTLSCNLKI